MRRIIPLALVLLGLATAGILAQDTASTELRAADDAWDSGNYIVALMTYVRLMNSPAADRVFDHIALQTGELYVSEELTADGRNPRLSADGRLIAYETGPTKNL